MINYKHIINCIDLLSKDWVAKYNISNNLYVVIQIKTNHYLCD